MNCITALTGDVSLNPPTIWVYTKEHWDKMTPMLVLLHHLGISVIPHLSNVYVKEPNGAPGNFALTQATVGCDECDDV